MARATSMLLALAVVTLLAVASAASISDELPSAAPRKLLQAGSANGNAPPANRTGLFGQLLQALRGNRNSRAVGLLSAASRNERNQTDAANAIIAASGSSGDRVRVASLLSDFARSDRNGLGSLLGRASVVAAQQGRTTQLAAAQKDALVAANRQGDVRPLALGLADATNKAGSAGVATTGEAMAQALAGGSESRQALAKATATVFCEGGASASAWAASFSVALSQDLKTGCLVLNQARALAITYCGGGVFKLAGFSKAFTDSDASSTVLGFCGLAPGLVPDLSIGNTDSSVQATPGMFGGGASGGNAKGTATTGPAAGIPAASAPAKKTGGGGARGNVFGVDSELFEGVDIGSFFPAQGGR